jgi:hypothetical protein
MNYGTEVEMPLISALTDYSMSVATVVCYISNVRKYTRLVSKSVAVCYMNSLNLM